MADKQGKQTVPLDAVAKVTAAGGGPGPDDARTWEEVGLEAMPGFVAFRTPADAPPNTPAGLIVVAERDTRPIVLEVLHAGPTGLKDDGTPDGYFVPGLKPGDRVMVPEYGVKIHENPLRGDLRFYEYRQLLAKIPADAVVTK